jgi:hypothetical protein
MAACAAVCQGIWLAQLLSDMTGEEAATPVLLIDNQSVIALNQNPIFHDRSKHIDVCYHFIRECVDQVDQTQLHIHRRTTDKHLDQGTGAGSFPRAT